MCVLVKERRMKEEVVSRIGRLRGICAPLKGLVKVVTNAQIAFGWVQPTGSMLWRRINQSLRDGSCANLGTHGHLPQAIEKAQSIAAWREAELCFVYRRTSTMPSNWRWNIIFPEDNEACFAYPRDTEFIPKRS